MKDISFKDTQISFVPSFSGNGWETSLLPRFKREHLSQLEYRITFGWLRRLLLKMRLGRGKEGASWTTAIARLFL